MSILLGIISDIHDHRSHLQAVLADAAARDVEHLLCLGDMGAPKILLMCIASRIPCTAIYGNNDAEKHKMALVAHESEGAFTLMNNTYGVVTMGGRTLCMIHHPTLALSLARSGDYDAVFYGHNHTLHQEYVGDCLVCNPGEICGYSTGTVSYAIYDTASNTAESITLSSYSL
ncbi:YfcE family phosphodiesterase [Candidatus Peribacteria bacterium]|nr:YfcE family phosphodiesterase [Candidatus Peribacteria bacterium]